MKKSLFFILFLYKIFCLGPAAADTLQDFQQDSIKSPVSVVPLEFDQEKIEGFRKDPGFDYSETLAEESWWSKFKQYLRLQWRNFINRLFGDYQTSGFLLVLLRAIPYLILLMALVLLVYLFSALNPAASLFTSTKEEKMIFDKEEDILRFGNIPALIEQAVSRADYRLAVRYHFLYLLQQLSLQGVITYDKTKTDEDYLIEIKRRDFRLGFKKLSRVYDYLWYGQFETGEETYYKIAEEFRQMEKKISNKYEHTL